MQPLAILADIKAGVRVNKSLVKAQAEAQARLIGNGYAVIDGSSYDVIQGEFSIDGEAPNWKAFDDKMIFTVASMLDSMKTGMDVIDQAMIEADLHKHLREEKSFKYILLLLEYAKNKKTARP
jgi:ribosomal protein L21